MIKDKNITLPLVWFLPFAVKILHFEDLNAAGWG